MSRLERPLQSSDLRLANLLGSGRHGMVFRAARDVDGISSPVAVKVPSMPGALDGEGRALEKFTHPNVVRLLEEPRQNGALVLEFCDLGTLADRLTHETLSPAEVGSLLTPLLGALGRIHDAGWIHGDISPANIGLRTTDGPALLDFATARPADGSPVAEGTAEFAGPLRQADPRLDIRALAATALVALGEQDRWDHRKRHSQESLVALIDRCDNGTEVQLKDLELIASTAIKTAPGYPRAGSPEGGPNVNPPTRAFGPPPVGPATDEPKGRSLRPLVVFICVLCIAAWAFEFRPAEPARAEAGSARLVAELTAEETFDQIGASWNVETGVVTIERSGRLHHLAAGEPGDLAAVGDWSCDGTETLGVFRPSTGTWYEYGSWSDGALAEIAHVDTQPRWAELLKSPEEVLALSVTTRSVGCDAPIVRVVSASGR